MKMIFDADETITVKEIFCGTWKIRKKELADFLISEQERDELKAIGRNRCLFGAKILERAVILSNLASIISIEVDSNIIRLNPIGIKMRVNDSIIDFLESKAENS